MAVEASSLTGAAERGRLVSGPPLTIEDVASSNYTSTLADESISVKPYGRRGFCNLGFCSQPVPETARGAQADDDHTSASSRMSSSPRGGYRSKSMTHLSSGDPSPRVTRSRSSLPSSYGSRTIESARPGKAKGSRFLCGFGRQPDLDVVDENSGEDESESALELRGVTSEMLVSEEGAEGPRLPGTFPLPENQMVALRTAAESQSYRSRTFVSQSASVVKSSLLLTAGSPRSDSHNKSPRDRPPRTDSRQSSSGRHKKRSKKPAEFPAPIGSHMQRSVFPERTALATEVFKSQSSHFTARPSPLAPRQDDVTRSAVAQETFARIIASPEQQTVSPQGEVPPARIPTYVGRQQPSAPLESSSTIRQLYHPIPSSQVPIPSRTISPSCTQPGLQPFQPPCVPVTSNTSQQPDSAGHVQPPAAGPHGPEGDLGVSLQPRLDDLSTHEIMQTQTTVRKSESSRLDHTSCVQFGEVGRFNEVGKTQASLTPDSASPVQASGAVPGGLLVSSNVPEPSSLPQSGGTIATNTALGLTVQAQADGKQNTPEFSQSAGVQHMEQAQLSGSFEHMQTQTTGALGQTQVSAEVSKSQDSIEQAQSQVPAMQIQAPYTGDKMPSERSANLMEGQSAAENPQQEISEVPLHSQVTAEHMQSQLCERLTQSQDTVEAPESPTSSGPSQTQAPADPQFQSQVSDEATPAPATASTARLHAAMGLTQSQGTIDCVPVHFPDGITQVSEVHREQTFLPTMDMESAQPAMEVRMQAQHLQQQLAHLRQSDGVDAWQQQSSVDRLGEVGHNISQIPQPAPPGAATMMQQEETPSSSRQVAWGSLNREMNMQNDGMQADASQSRILQPGMVSEEEAHSVEVIHHHRASCRGQRRQERMMADNQQSFQMGQQMQGSQLIPQHPQIGQPGPFSPPHQLPELSYQMTQMQPPQQGSQHIHTHVAHPPQMLPPQHQPFHMMPSPDRPPNMQPPQQQHIRPQGEVSPQMCPPQYQPSQHQNSMRHGPPPPQYQQLPSQEMPPHMRPQDAQQSQAQHMHVQQIDMQQTHMQPSQHVYHTHMLQQGQQSDQNLQGRSQQPPHMQPMPQQITSLESGYIHQASMQRTHAQQQQGAMQPPDMPQPSWIEAAGDPRHRDEWQSRDLDRNQIGQSGDGAGDRLASFPPHEPLIRPPISREQMRLQNGARKLKEQRRQQEIERQQEIQRQQEGQRHQEARRQQDAQVQQAMQQQQEMPRQAEQAGMHLDSIRPSQSMDMHMDQQQQQQTMQTRSGHLVEVLSVDPQVSEQVCPEFERSVPIAATYQPSHERGEMLSGQGLHGAGRDEQTQNVGGMSQRVEQSPEAARAAEAEMEAQAQLAEAGGAMSPMSEEEQQAIYRRQQLMSSQEEHYQISNEFSDPEHPQEGRWSPPRAPEGLLIGAQGGVGDVSPVVSDIDARGPGLVWRAESHEQQMTSMSRMQASRGREPSRATAPMMETATSQYFATVSVGQPIASVSGETFARGSGVRSESCVPATERYRNLAASGRSRARSAQPRLGGGAIDRMMTEKEEIENARIRESIIESLLKGLTLREHFGDANVGVDAEGEYLIRKIETFDIEQRKTEIKTKETREFITEKKKPVVYVREKFVDVPSPQVVEKIVEKDVYEDRVVHKPVKTTVDRPVEYLTYKTVYIDEVKEEARSVPGEIVEVPRKFIVERPVIMPKYIDRKVPIVVAQSFWPIVTEAEEADESCSIEVAVRVTNFVVQYQDYHIPAPIARPMVFSRLKVEHKEVQQNLITDEQYNALIKALNPELQTDDALDLFRFIQAERLQSMQGAGSAYFQTELGVLPMATGMGTHKVEMSDDLQVEAASDSRLQSAASTYTAPLSLAPNVQTVPIVVAQTQLIPDVQTLPLIPTIPTSVLPIDYHSVHTDSPQSGKEARSLHSASLQSHHHTNDSYPPPSMKPSPLQPTGSEASMSGSLVKIHHVQMDSQGSFPLPSHRQTDSGHTQSGSLQMIPCHPGLHLGSSHNRSGSLVDSARGQSCKSHGTGSLGDSAHGHSGNLHGSGTLVDAPPQSQDPNGSHGLGSLIESARLGSGSLIDSARDQSAGGRMTLGSARNASVDSACAQISGAQGDGGSLLLTGRGPCRIEGGSLSSTSTQQQDHQAQISTGTRQWMSAVTHQATFPDSEETSESVESSICPSLPKLSHRGPKLCELEVNPPAIKPRRPLEERLRQLVESVAGVDSSAEAVPVVKSAVWQVSRNKVKGSKHQPRYYAKRMAY